MMYGDDRLSEFRIVKSQCGLPTAVHVPSGILLHSKMDPLSEAKEFVAERAAAAARTTVLLGGGLGYIAEALAEVKRGEHSIYVIEPDVALWALVQYTRSGAPYFTLPNIHRVSVVFPHLLTTRCQDVAATADLLVAPYFERIASYVSSPLEGFLQMLRTERVSRVVYNSIVAEHSSVNAARLDSLANVVDVRVDPKKRIVVAGAGPSLDSCLDALRNHRHRLVIIAASGAVPALQAAEIAPDWVIALEGKDVVVKDLANLTADSAFIVFPSTHPQVFDSAVGTLFRGSDLETRGGTTAIPALDFALRCSQSDIFLVGMDLSNYRGTYAVGTLRNRDTSESPLYQPPKFIAMRAALENLLNRRKPEARLIYHVLADAPILNRTRRLQPQYLERTLALPLAAKEIV